MIDPDYCRLLARYNRWMNERLYATVSEFTDEERTRDRGAFFGSMQRTLSHLLWADRAWLARFTGERYDEAAYGADLYRDFATMQCERDVTDTALLNWAGQVDQAWLDSTLHYRRRADDKVVAIPAWVAATHVFNHATHHRGQIATLIRQAGKDPGATDLPWMPGIMQFE